MSISQTPTSGIMPDVYAQEPDMYDEMWDAQQGVRPHWQKFFHALESLGGNELERRRNEAHILLRENGVTYNVHGDPDGLHRPWELDPIPLLLQAEDWTHIAKGLQQRAELFNLILNDLYGPRDLIRKGLLPIELVLNHAGFLRACDGVKLSAQHQLRIYTADLARGPNGQMWVLRDRTQAPSGVGYALENRTVMSRIMPTQFRDCNVRRLANFFRDLQVGLSEITPHQKDDPRVVLLTPGPYNATYFEHAYLASYLGYPLVQGDDLTVRDGHVYLKSIDGLQPVDVILRRVNDDFCDPLELNEKSQLGVAGLLEAVRRGNVAIANPLGSSVLENPGLMAFLPGISEHLLGEKLKLPSAATWWCGQERECQYVLENLENLVISSIYRQPDTHRVFGALLTKAEQAQWRDRIRANPAFYVGQERVSFSTAPSLIKGHLESRHTILSAFAVSRNNAYAIMPGGLTRSAPERGNFVVSTNTIVISKDTWVLANEPEPYISLWQQTGWRVTPTSRGTLPSRAAENLFWVGRYAERAEGAIRLMRTVLQNLSERRENEEDIARRYRSTLLQALTRTTGTLPGFVGKGAGTRLRHPDREMMALIRDQDRPGSLAFTIQAFIQAAFAVRDRWSNDTWRVIDSIDAQWAAIQAPDRVDFPEIQNTLNQVLTGLVAFTGLTQESMTRELGWRVLDTGRRIERSLLQISLMRATLIERREGMEGQLLMETVLTVMESLITHRRRYRAYLNLQTVLELLLLDELNPRALAYQMARLSEHMTQLPRQQDQLRLSEEERFILDASTRLRLSDPMILSTIDGQATKYQALEQLLRHQEEHLKNTSNIITHTYFSHARGTQQLTPTFQEIGA